MTEVQNSEKDGRKVLEWTLENPAPPKSDRTNFSVYDPAADPGVGAATFKSYGEVAAAYGVRVHPKAAVTDSVRKACRRDRP